ncbi:protein FAM162A [Ambystoma mexicanum]|uniref:protein FAM162A n=1 Tax=Ambystoma mexicanum TaxID=8296 RepID=UPI0037E88381
MWSLSAARGALGRAARLFRVSAVTPPRHARAGLCAKPAGDKAAPEAETKESVYSFKVPGHKPTNMEKRLLLWAGRFKKEEDIPEIVSFEMIDAAKNKVRVKVSYIMIVLTIMGCITMVVSGKRAVGRHESLSGMNLEKKARLREESHAAELRKSE